MSKYKISYTGFAYVEANSPEEAEEKYNYEEHIYEETCIESVEKVDKFVVTV